MSRVEVSPRIIRWAITRSGLPEVILERKFPKINEWIRGAVSPTLRQLEKFAKATTTPFGYLFLSEPPVDQLTIPHFRTVTDGGTWSPSPNLLETVQIMQRRQEWMREFLIQEGQERLRFIRSASVGDNPTTVANGMRQELGLADGWASNIRTWTDALRALIVNAEDAGILVVVNGIVGNNTHRKLDPNEFRGFVLTDEFAPLVFINGADGKAAQMFTLAHELAHLWFGESAAFDLRQLLPASDAVEQSCNRVAAEFLVPEAELRQLWPEASSESEPFQVVARQFKVSSLVAARRALDLGLIGRDEFFAFLSQYQVDERRKASTKSDGGDFYANQNQRVGRRFGQAVLVATMEGRLLYHEAYQLTGLHGKTFEQWGESVRSGGGR